MSKKLGTIKLEDLLLPADEAVQMEAVWVHDGETSKNATRAMPGPGMLFRISWNVTQAFNGTGTNTISLGYVGDDTAYGSFSAGSIATGQVVLGGYDATARTPRIKYNGVGATSGKAIAVYQYVGVPTQP